MTTLVCPETEADGAIRHRVDANVVLEAALLALVDQRECVVTTDAGSVEVGKTPCHATAPVNGPITNQTGHDASSPSQTIMVTALAVETVMASLTTRGLPSIRKNLTLKTLYWKFTQLFTL